MFSFIKQKLQKIYANVTGKLHALFSGGTLDQATLKELEVILLSADTGVNTTRMVIDRLKAQWTDGMLTNSSELKAALKEQLLAILTTSKPAQISSITLLVGINGSGKTTVASKLAYQLMQQKKRVLLVAADTFRAAAVDQLKQWADRLGVQVVCGAPNQDPASVVYAGMQCFKQGHFDAVIIDTAGRLQTKANLMKELEKVKRVISAQAPDIAITTLLTVDAMLGQNSLEQARVFHESTQLSGIVLTKMDGTGKGGIVFAISHELAVPVAYISFGESPEQLKLFDPATYVSELLETT